MTADPLRHIYVAALEPKGAIDGWAVGSECLGEVLCGHGCGSRDQAVHRVVEAANAGALASPRRSRNYIG